MGIPVPTLIRISVKSVVSAQMPARTTQSHLGARVEKACPVDAITYDEYGVCEIDENKCIQCGRLHPQLSVRCSRQNLYGRCHQHDQGRKEGRSNGGTGYRGASLELTLPWQAGRPR